MTGFNGLRASLRPWRVRACATTALMAGLALAPAAALASAHISGTEAAISVDAQNSSIKDILAALGEQFNVHLQATAALDKQVSGTYEGSLRQVLVRLLDGYNFIIRVHDGQLLVTVLGGKAPSSGGTSSTTVAAAAPSQSPQPSAVKTEPATTPSMPVAAAATNAGVPEVTPNKASSGPVPTLKVAEGPAPVPQPSGASSGGPVAGPPTSKMPMPTPGGAATSMTPIPAPGPSTGDVPAPSGTPVAPPQPPQNK
jgi:hypothetical protein